MALRTRLLLSMTLLALIPLLIFGLMAFYASTNSLINVERDSLNQAVDRVNRALNEIQNSLVRTTTDNAFWDDIHRVVVANSANDEFFLTNYDPSVSTSTVNTFNLQLLSIWGADGTLLYHVGPADRLSQLAAYRSSVAQAARPLANIAAVDNDLYIVTYSTVRKSDGTEPVGLMLMGKKLGQPEVDYIKALTGSDVALFAGKMPIATTRQNPTPPSPNALERASKGEQVLDQTAQDEALAYSPVKDSGGNIIGTFVLWRPRLTTVAAQASIGSTLAAGFVFGAVLAVIVAVLVQQTITRPLLAMADTAGKIAAGDLTQRVQWPSPDELGRLATAFNQMTEKVAQRVTESENETVRLQNLDEYRLTLLSAITQELNSPIDNIREYADSLEMQMYGGLNEAQNRLVSSIRRSNVILETLVADLIDFASAQQKKLRINRETIPLDSAIREVIPNIEERFPDKEVQLSTTLPSDLSRLFVDPIRLSQILDHLLTWVYDSTVPNGRVSISAVEQGMNVRITISDTSAGLEPEEAAQAFDLFYHPKSIANGKDAEKSNGLGLALVKALIEQHGGKINLEVHEGRGNTFTVSLPRAD